MLSPQVEADEGGAFFDLTVRSRDMYPDFAAAISDETGVDVEFDRTGTLYLAFSDAELRRLHTRYAWQREAGLAVEQLAADEARRVEPFASPDVKGALFFPRDWQIDNRKLLTSLRRYAELNGIDIVENSSVEAIAVENGRVAGVETGVDFINATRVVAATGAWTSLIKLGDATMPFSVEPVKGQIIAFQTAKRLFEHVIYSRRGYIVPRTDGRILAGSTSESAGFDTNATDEAAASLQKVAVEIAPSIASLEIADRWAGLRPFAADGLPVLGGVAGIDGLTIATAHYRNGILLAPVTAEIVADKVVDGVDSPALTTFGPDRLRFAAAGPG
jgi:glycine oxidase